MHLRPWRLHPLDRYRFDEIRPRAVQLTVVNFTKPRRTHTKAPQHGHPPHPPICPEHTKLAKAPRGGGNGGFSQRESANFSEAPAQLKFLHEGNIRNAADCLQRFASYENALIAHDSATRKEAHRAFETRSKEEHRRVPEDFPKAARNDYGITQTVERRVRGVVRNPGIGV